MEVINKGLGGKISLRTFQGHNVFRINLDTLQGRLRDPDVSKVVINRTERKNTIAWLS